MAATYKHGLWQDSENLKALTNNVACNLVLGLLLVFRTNTAYERYWIGRQAWGTLIITTRNIAREIQVGIDAPTAAVREEKTQALKKLVSFAIATKCFILPLGLVEQLGWWTPSAIALVSFVLLGIEEIGNEIENPFGYGFNNIKLDAICDTLLKDIQTTLAFTEDGVLAQEETLEAALNNDVAIPAEAA